MYCAFGCACARVLAVLNNNNSNSNNDDDNDDDDDDDDDHDHDHDHCHTRTIQDHALVHIISGCSQVLHCYCHPCVRACVHAGVCACLLSCAENDDVSVSAAGTPTLACRQQCE